MSKFVPWWDCLYQVVEAQLGKHELEQGSDDTNFRTFYWNTGVEKVMGDEPPIVQLLVSSTELNGFWSVNYYAKKTNHLRFFRGIEVEEALIELDRNLSDLRNRHLTDLCDRRKTGESNARL